METLVLRRGLRFRQAELGARVGESGFYKIFKISAILAGIVLLLGTFLFFDFQNPTVLRSTASSVPATKNMLTAATTGAGQPVIASTPQMLEMNIANNGSTFIRGATVVAVSGNVIQADISWGPTDFTWTIETSGTTKFLNQQGQKQTISNIKVGDIVTVTGKLANQDNKYVINAEFVRY